MIGLLQLLAVLLVVETWFHNLESADWHAYIDNDGVRYAIINAAAERWTSTRLSLYFGGGFEP